MGTDPLDGDLDLRYSRVGPINQGRLCDKLAAVVDILFQGDSLPARWRMDPEALVEDYGPGLLWSRTQSYRLLLVRGQPVFRLWTNTKASWVWIDLTPEVVAAVNRYFTCEAISVGTLRRCYPCTHKIKVHTIDDILLFTTLVRDLYDLGNP